MKIRNILIVSFGNTGNEPEALRQTLESFNYCVVMKYIGRPNDFIDVLKSKLQFIPDCIILSCHGEDGEIAMPVLSNEVYDVEEPRGHFTYKEINKYIDLYDKLIISLGCTTGNKELSKAFTVNGNVYIAPENYIDGNSALFFTIRLFYELEQNKKSIYDAYVVASETDKETELFKFRR